MKKASKIPRILKIEAVDDFKIFCVFNTGEFRIIDFKPIFKKFNYEVDPLRSKLMEPAVFIKVKLEGGTLRWPEVIQKTKLSNGMEFTVPFELDPIVLYELSEADEARNKKYQIGELLRNARKAAGITQEELANRSGTTKNYISRIENNHSDIELRTLIKIVEIGLEKQLSIQVR